MSAATHKHAQRPKHQPDGPLQLAQRQLHDAIHDLTAHRYHPLGWLDPRYTQLRDALKDATVSGHTRTQPSSQSPVWLDALDLTTHIDTRITHIANTARTPPDTPARRLQQTLKTRWRPQDSKYLMDAATEIRAWCKRIDDLFDTTARRYLYDPLHPTNWATCPRCGHDHAFVASTDGTNHRVPALSINIDHGASCARCHDCWPPEHLQFLALQLGCPPPEGTG